MRIDAAREHKQDRLSFGKARRQTRESAHPCANGQIVSFNVSGSDQCFVWSTANNLTLDCFELTRTDNTRVNVAVAHRSQTKLVLQLEYLSGHIDF